MRAHERVPLPRSQVLSLCLTCRWEKIWEKDEVR